MGARRFLPIICGIVLVIFLTAVSSPSAAPPSLERYAAADKDRVDLRRGQGIAVFRARGAIFGALRRWSRLRIVDLPRGLETEISVDGAEEIKVINDRTTVYIGRDMLFRIEKGWWHARIQGRGIFAGAAVHGTLALRGTAGKYSIGDGDFRAWPNQRRVFHLG
jgi:hypothetical protein